MFPFGFTYMTLATTAVFMIHSMLFFWHRYELPALANRHVTADNPRMSSSPSNRNFIDRNGIPHVPNAPIPRLTSRQSISSSQGRGGSRHSSALALFQAGDEDDDTSSYMFFMDGEVVMHGDRRSLRSLPSGSLDGGESSASVSHPQIPESISTGAGGDHAAHHHEMDEPSVAEEEALLGTTGEESASPADVSPESVTPRANNRATDIEYVEASGGAAPLPDFTGGDEN